MMSSGGGSGGPGGGMGPGVGGGGDGRHDDEAALTEFLSTLMDYTPMIPDELVEHYLDRSGFQCPDLRLTRLVAVATQKFLSDIASDSLQEGGKENRRRVGGEGAIKAKNLSCCHPCWLRWENDVS